MHYSLQTQGLEKGYEYPAMLQYGVWYHSPFVCRVVPGLFYVTDNIVQDAAVAKAVACTAGHFEQLADDRLIKSTPYLDLALKPFDDVTLSSQTVCCVECGLSRVVTMITHALMQSTSHNTSVRWLVLLRRFLLFTATAAITSGLCLTLAWLGCIALT